MLLMLAFLSSIKQRNKDNLVYVFEPQQVN